MDQRIEELFRRQLDCWEEARNNYAALHDIKIKTLDVGQVTYTIQFNPARIVSSSAKVDKQSILRRPCFLCAENRPAEQEGLPIGGHYTLLVNPLPIFPHHLTLPENRHTEQCIIDRFDDMLGLARELKDFTLFYNGPRCGASAPDHAHFQAGDRHFMPIESNWRPLVADTVGTLRHATLYHLKDLPRTTLVLESADRGDLVELFNIIYNEMTLKLGNDEPMMNLLTLYEDGGWVVFLFPRDRHRPACFDAEGDDNLLSSPASVELGGVFITPVAGDFEKIDSAILSQILSEVCLSPDKFSQLIERIRQHL